MIDWRFWRCLIQRWLTIAGSSIVTLCNINPSTTAQSPLPAKVKIHPNTADAIKQTILNRSHSTIPLLSASQPTPAQPPVNAVPKRDRFSIKKVQVLGSTVLHSEIAALIKPYENREVTFEELIGLRSAITQLYIQNGYVTSGAFLPNNQSLNDGVVQIQVVEGELETIELRV